MENIEKRKYIFEPTTLETRIDSYNQIDAKQRQEQVLEVLGDEILSAKEIAVKMHEKGYTQDSDRNNASPRLNELLNQGVVEIFGKKKCEYSGKTVVVYKLKNNKNSEETNYKEKYEKLYIAYENMKNIEAFTRVRINELKKENENLRKELKKRS